ncbi:Cytosolic carboxypeptidase [Heracleum sosnowskyi]|uniref:Cytosolic carboxypeptidase n=1 Tax=Heracleum sosnowskyi TaxID=360622 RepID=A0AAD8LWS0_9APIA|nr:Cytosolic carboxypeptidase [Heracleum sosnowskyi]
MASRKRSLSNDVDSNALHKEWDEASCPICMDHPHNAVLLLCSSYSKGCRSYICDTSYRHSNCLDRFKKLKAQEDNNTSPPELLPRDPHRDTRNNTSDSTSVRVHNLIPNNAIASEDISGRSVESRSNVASTHFGRPGGDVEGGGSDLSGRIVPAEINDGNFSEARSNLRCPLCRGDVLGWQVVDEARKYLNSKSRSCSRETCSFSGSYGELRRHARRIHPSARPSDIDPVREQAWRHLEHQREYGDIVSAIRTAMPGAVVFGDYVIENGERAPGARERGSGERGERDGPWWTTFFLFQMLGTMDHAADRRSGRSRGSTTRFRRSNGTGRRYLWGRNLLGAHNDDDDDDDNDSDVNILSDTNEDASPIPRRRRRLTRYRSNEDRS